MAAASSAAAEAVHEIEAYAEAIAGCIRAEAEAGESIKGGVGTCATTAHVLVGALLRWSCAGYAPPRARLLTPDLGHGTEIEALPAHVILLDVRPLDCAALVAAMVADALSSGARGTSNKPSPSPLLSSVIGVSM